MVEYELPKLGVASSNLVARSTSCFRHLAGRFLGLALSLLVGGSARAEEPSWWIGLPIASVTVTGPIPDDSLAPLLKSQQFELANPVHVRNDLETLFRVGEFASVEAEVQGMEAHLTTGDVPGVAITFRVSPAPRVSRVKIMGDNPHFSDRELLGAAGLGRGANFYPEVGVAVTRSRILGELARAGYPAGAVEVRHALRTRGQRIEIEIEIEVAEGEPDLLDDVAFVGDLALLAADGSERRLRKWVKQAGLRPGQPFRAEAVTRAQLKLRAELADLHRPLFRPRRGWIAARVIPAVVSTPSEGRRVNIAIEPGARLDLDVSGIRSLRADRRARVALGIDERLRLTRGFLEEAAGRLASGLQDDGFLEATAEVKLDEVDKHTNVLRIDVDQGSRFKLKRGAWPNRVGAQFTGNEHVPTSDLQAVLEQASEEVLRRGSFTPAAFEEALQAAEAYYGARGYQRAELTSANPEFRKRRRWMFPAAWLRAVSGAPPVFEVRLQVAVEEGPLTRQHSVTTVGLAPELKKDVLAPIQRELKELAGKPFSPQRVELLKARILELHRESGFLEADARVVSALLAEGEVRSTIEVTPGPQVLLRSVVTRGLRAIKPDFVRREVDLRLGEPLAFSAQQRVRDDLYNLGAFRSVELTLLGDEAARDLVIGVAERAPWAFEAGGGVSTDQGTRLFGRLTRRNLFRLPHRLEFQGQVGLDWLSDSVVDWRPDVRNPDFRAVATYTAPRFPVRAQDLTLDLLFRERLAERTWRMARTGGGIGLEHHLAFGPRSLDLRAAVRLETRQLQEVDTGALLAGEPWERILKADPTIPTAWRLQDSVTALAAYDARDSQLAPSRGFVLQATGEFAPGELAEALSDQPSVSFAKAGGRFTGYLPMFGLTLRASGGSEIARGLDGGVVPLEDRFRLGGTTSLRGFARDTVGPRALASRLEVDFPSQIDPIIDYSLRNRASRWVPTGGDLSAQGSLELQIPWPAIGLTAWDGWAGAVFADFGNAWLLSPDTTVTSNLPRYAALIPTLRTGLGAGLRVATPVGPLQLDLATNLQALTATGDQQALLRDEWEEPQFRAHLSLGALW